MTAFEKLIELKNKFNLSGERSVEIHCMYEGENVQGVSGPIDILLNTHARMLGHLTVIKDRVETDQTGYPKFIIEVEDPDDCDILKQDPDTIEKSLAGIEGYSIQPGVDNRPVEEKPVV